MNSGTVFRGIQNGDLRGCPVGPLLRLRPISGPGQHWGVIENRNEILLINVH